MAKTIQQTFRLPTEVAEALDAKGNSTEYVVAALREMFLRDEPARFRQSARRIASLPPAERDVEFAFAAQAEAAGWSEAPDIWAAYLPAIYAPSG